jgi:Tfp pilus assembly protein PilN
MATRLIRAAGTCKSLAQRSTLPRVLRSEVWLLAVSLQATRWAEDILDNMEQGLDFSATLLLRGYESR